MMPSQPTTSTKPFFIAVGIFVVVAIAIVVALKLKTNKKKDKKNNNKKNVTPEENPKWTNCWMNQDCDMYEGLPPYSNFTKPGTEQKNGCAYCPRPYSGNCKVAK